jgi:uncharacterized repeat protein (TIGR03803 family)
LVQGNDGNFYGTTASGGNNASDAGVVFRITPGGKLIVIHNFDGSTHGGLPFDPLVQGSDGNFYGTTLSSTGPTGVVFKITPSGTFSVLHTMNATTDGELPYAGLVQATDGNFYGVNSGGGSHGLGTIFKISPTGSYSVLYNFDGITGSKPEVTAFQHTNGTICGDTQSGGTGNVSCSAGTCGVFYRFSASTSLPPFISLLPYSGKVGKYYRNSRSRLRIGNRRFFQRNRCNTGCKNGDLSDGRRSQRGYYGVCNRYNIWGHIDQQ